MGKEELLKKLRMIELFIASTDNLLATDLVEHTTDAHFKIEANEELKAVKEIIKDIKNSHIS